MVPMPRPLFLLAMAITSALLAIAAETRVWAEALEGAAPQNVAPKVLVGVKCTRARRARVEWDPSWQRVRLWEYPAIAGLFAVDWYVRYHEPPPDRPSWEGNNAFDDTIRGWLVASSREGRRVAAKVSDDLVLAGAAFPFAVDLPVVLFVHGQPSVMWQMLMMDLEANAVAGVVNNTLFHYGGRARPNTQNCNADASYDSFCNSPGDNASFPSGHVLTIATAAGLVCVHHRYLPIYGSDAADTGSCVLMAAATVATGIARIVADRHFATDVLSGALIGFSSGYGLPWLLHYRTGDVAGSGEARPSIALLPMAGPGLLGLSVAGLVSL
jgi:membrane-associated phospholipid phosphatase